MDRAERTSKSQALSRKRKFERATPQQLEFYINFCKKHPDLETVRKSSTTCADFDKLWQTCVDELNKLDGPERTVEKWRESLAVWRSQQRSRARRRSKHSLPRNSTPCPPKSPCPEDVNGTRKPIPHQPLVVATVGTINGAETSLNLSFSNTEIKEEKLSPLPNGWVSDDQNMDEKTTSPFEMENQMDPNELLANNSMEVSQSKTTTGDLLAAIMILVKKGDEREQRYMETFQKTYEAITELNNSIKLMVTALNNK